MSNEKIGGFYYDGKISSFKSYGKVIQVAIDSHGNFTINSCKQNSCKHEKIKKIYGESIVGTTIVMGKKCIECNKQFN